MKRIALLILAAVLILFSGCSKGEEQKEESSAPPVVPSPVISEPPAPAPVIGQIVNVDAGSYANVRGGPGTNQDIIGKALPDETYEVDVDGGADGWVKIEYKGKPGYISSDYIARVEN